MDRQSTLVRSTVLFYGALLVSAGLWDRWSDSVTLQWISGENRTDAWGVLAGFGFAAVVILGGIWSRRFEFARRLENLFKDALGAPGHLEILVLALTSAIAEEAFFRGALQQSLGMWVSVIVFGAMHGFFRPPYLAWSIFATIAGLFWSGLVLWTDSLLPVVLSHAMINGINLELLAHRWRKEQ